MKESPFYFYYKKKGSYAHSLDQRKEDFQAGYREVQKKGVPGLEMQE